MRSSGRRAGRARRRAPAADRLAAPRRILIVRLSAIGDVVHGLPLLCRLRRGFPDAKIAWAVGPTAAPLLERHPALDEAIVLDKHSPLAFLRAATALKRRRFDVAIDLQSLVHSALVVALSGARTRLGFDLPRVRERAAALAHTRRLPPGSGTDGDPIIEQNLGFADALGAPPAPLEFGLAPSLDERDAAARALAPLGGAPFAAFIVGAGKDANRPFYETLATAARLLERAGLAVAVLGGARDRTEAAAVGGLNLCGTTPLRTTLAVLERARVAIAGDTGPLHMAAALGTPVVTLFGGSNPRRTGPNGLGPVRMIWKAWRCAPCYLKRCPIGRECLAAISGEEVAAAALDVAGSGRPG